MKPEAVVHHPHRDGTSCTPGAHPDASPWLDLHHVSRLQRHWQHSPVRLTGAAAPNLGLPTRAQLDRWMRTDRLSSAHARLWRAPARTNALCMPLDPREWTHERRLGDQRMTGLLHADAVQRELGQGAWLQVQNLHRLDAALAAMLSRWQQALGLPLRIHGWCGQARQTGAADLSDAWRNTRLVLSEPDAARPKFIVVLEGELSVSWSAPAGATGNAMPSEDADNAAASTDKPTRRSLQAKAGDVLYLPRASSLRWNTRSSVWAVELSLAALTPLDILTELGAAALQTLRNDEPALRRCVAENAAASTAEADIDANDATCLIQALRASALPSAARQALQRHQSRIDEDTAASSGRLTALSRLFEADANTPLVGRPDRVLGRYRNPGRISLRLARKELHFDAKLEGLLDFMLQGQPHCLAEAPGNVAPGHLMRLAKGLAAEGMLGVE